MKLTYKGLDSWSRPVYEDKQGQLWKDVDPRSFREPEIFSAQFNAFDGEPNNPLHGTPDFVPFRVTWDNMKGA